MAQFLSNPWFWVAVIVVGFVTQLVMGFVMGRVSGGASA